jgi:tetratricopeptide (TPR) repeat protein
MVEHVPADFRQNLELGRFQPIERQDWAEAAMMQAELKRVLMMARSGATLRAWEAFASAGLLERNDNPAALTLKGRLLKDQARAAAGADRARLFAESGEAYSAAARLRPDDSYPLINAAAMALFAGNDGSAQTLATMALALIDDGIDPGETPYWREATRAEALLLLGRNAEAQSSLSAAITNAPQAWEDRAATLRQFALILEHSGQEAGWLDALRPPPMLHYSGILRIGADDKAAEQAIHDAVRVLNPAAGFGALAAGADIIVAEALLMQGSDLHVILPSAVDVFREASVSPFGEAWEARFDHVIGEATTVECCFDPDTLTCAAIAQTDAVALGSAFEKASQFETTAVGLHVVRSGSEPADTVLQGKVIIAVNAEPANNGKALLDEGSLTFHLARGDAGQPSLSDHDSFDAAAKAASGVAQSAISCSLVGDEESGRDQALALHKNASPGTIIASRNVALAALAAGRCKRTEPLGELTLPLGAVPVCALVGLL